MDKPFNLHHTYANQEYYATRLTVIFLSVMAIYSCLTVKPLQGKGSPPKFKCLFLA